MTVEDIMHNDELSDGDVERELRRVIAEVCGQPEATDPLRDLHVTPFDGWYGLPAGYVICINGSPPRGVVFVMTGHQQVLHVVSLNNRGQSRRWGDDTRLHKWVTKLLMQRRLLRDPLS